MGKKMTIDQVSERLGALTSESAAHTKLLENIDKQITDFASTVAGLKKQPEICEGRFKAVEEKSSISLKIVAVVASIAAAVGAAISKYWPT